MWLDVNLDWHYHIDVMRSKISRRIGVLKRLRSAKIIPDRRPYNQTPKCNGATIIRLL